MKLLAVSLPRHDGNISYYDGVSLRYIKLERLKKIKRFHFSNRWDWFYEVQNLWGINPKDIDKIIFDFHPESYFHPDFFPKEIHSVLNGELNVVKLNKDISPFNDFLDHDNIFYIGHHYAHSLSSWMLSDEDPNVNIVIDGIGDHRTWSVFRKNKLIDFGNYKNGSIGGEMGKLGAQLGIVAHNGNDIAGKLMSLQSYGKLDHGYIESLKNLNHNHIREIFSFENWKKYKGDELVAKNSQIDWAASVHFKMTSVLVEFFKKFANQNEIISYTGGVAQNIIWNTELKKHFPKLIIPPHSADEGLSLGSIEWLRRDSNLPKFKLDLFPYCQYDHSPEEPTEQTILDAAKLLSNEKIIGWYQGHGEIGPRALGNRSVLMDPRISNGKSKINELKNREPYRPFGASILAEYVNDFFDIVSYDEYMLYIAKVKSNSFPSITHYDDTCRLQVVLDTESIFGKLLKKFHQLTGCPILLNTSLNFAGMPISGYPEMARDYFYSSNIDAMFVGNIRLIR